MRTPFSALLAAALTLGVLVAPAGADGSHSSMNFTCADPSPSGAGQHGTLSCSFTLNPNGDFGNTSNDKPDRFEIQLPVDMKVNEKGTHDAPDPSDGEKIGQMTVSGDFAYDGCGDNNDGATYNMYWETTYTSYTAPAGWTKVAQFNTVLTVLFFFTENVPTHVIKNNTTGQYAFVTDWPQDRGCTGSTLTFNPYVVYGYAQNNSSQEWVLTNPSAAGNYTICLVASEVGGTTHTDCDTITIT